MKKLYKELENIYKMSTNKQNQKQFNDEMVRKTMEYQKKFGFKLNPRPKHELWNVEGDAFKHTFGSAEMALNMGQLGSLIGGVFHELQTPNNPKNEWNMDSWNNAEGRKIANEIKKEFGNKLETMSEKEKDAIIATKVMMKMRSGELITHPDDKRQFSGLLENIIKYGTPTGQAANIETPAHIFTREEIGNMTTDEYAQNEPAILKQWKEKGIPTKRELENRQSKSSTGKSSGNSGGRWVTINGNHVLIEN